MPVPLLPALLLTSTVLGQRPAARALSLRADVDLVLVPVTVIDRRGATVADLKREQFHVFEDKVERQIVAFSSEETPCSIGLVFDLSGSMRHRIEEAKSAARALLNNTAEGDEVFLVTFSDRPEPGTQFAQDLVGVEHHLEVARTGGRTALVDAVYLAANRMRSARHPHRVLIVVSDGMDNHSRYSRGELKPMLLESDVQVYTIGVHDPPRDRKPIELRDEQNGVHLMESIADVTGGLHFRVRGLADAREAAGRIGRVIHHQYLLGYRPVKPGPEGWRTIRVKVEAPSVHLYARSRYYSPGE